MQPQHDGYLANFQQPHNQNIVESKEPEKPGFGKGLAIGFTILVLIWTLEVFAEWGSIQDEKKKYYEPEENDDPVTYKYAECNPDDSSYDQRKCNDLYFDEGIENREVDMYIEMVKIGAWITIWVSLARLMIFGNVSYRVMMSREKNE